MISTKGKETLNINENFSILSEQQASSGRVAPASVHSKTVFNNVSNKHAYTYGKFEAIFA